MKELIGLVQDNVPWLAVVLVCLSFVFEFSKVKVNPWSWMFKTFKNKMTEDIQKDNITIHKENADINKRLDEVVYIKSEHYKEIVQWKDDMSSIVKGLEDVNAKIIDAIDNINAKLDEMYQSQDENEMVRLRWEILSFADSCRSGNKHSKDAFHHIIEGNDKYHRIIDKRGFVNGVIDAEMEYIVQTYQKCLEENDFA